MKEDEDDGPELLGTVVEGKVGEEGAESGPTPDCEYELFELKPEEGVEYELDWKW